MRIRTRREVPVLAPYRPAPDVDGFRPGFARSLGEGAHVGGKELDTETMIGPTRPYEVRLFGGPHLFCEGEPVPLAPLERQFLGFVAAHGPEGVERDAVSETLWLAGSREARLQRISQTLHATLRKAGGGSFIRRAGNRLVMSSAMAGCDLETMEQSLGSSDDLGAAVDLACLGFFGGLEEGMTRSLYEWVALRRVEWRARVRERLAARAQYVDDQVLPAEMEAVARLQLRLDPTLEEPLRRLVRGLGLQGRPVEARAAYESFRERALSTDPSWTPEADTLDTLGGVEGMGYQWAGVPWDSAEPLFATRPNSSQLVGAIRTALSKVKRDPTRVPVIRVQGPDGVDIEDLVSAAVAGFELDGHRAIWIVPTQLTFSEFALSGSTAGESHRAMADTPRRPVIIVFSGPAPSTGSTEEAQCDPIEFEPTSGAVVITVLAESEELTGGSTGAIRFGSEAYEHAVIDVLPYSDREVGALLRERFGPTVPDFVLESAVRVARGLPMVAFDLVSTWARTPPADRLRDEAVARLMGSMSMNGISGTVRSVLGALTLHRDPLEVDLIASCLDIGPFEASRAVTSLLRRGWLVRAETGFTLRNLEMGDVLAHAFSPEDRVRLHSAIADSLPPGSNAVDRAGHLVNAIRFEDAVPELLAASEECGNNDRGRRFETLARTTLRRLRSASDRSRLAVGLCAYLLRTARPDEALATLVPLFESGDLAVLPRQDQQRAELLRIRALTQTVPNGDATLAHRAVELRDELVHSGAWELLAELLKLTMRSSDIGVLTPEMSSIHNWLSGLVDRLQRDEGAVPTPIAVVLGGRLRYSNDEQARSVIRDLLFERGSSDFPPEVLVEAYQTHVFGLYHAGVLNLDDGIRARQALMIAANSSRDPVRVARQHLNNAVWHLDTLDLDSAESALARARPLIAEHGSQPLRAELLFNEGELQLHRGRATAAERCFAEGATAVGESADGVGRTLFASGLAICRVLRDDMAGAKEIAPPSDHLRGTWTTDLTLLLRTVGLLAHREGRKHELPALVGEIKDRLRDQSLLWYLKVLTVARSLGVELDPDEVQEAVRKADGLNLGDLSRGLSAPARKLKRLDRLSGRARG